MRHLAGRVRTGFGYGAPTWPSAWVAITVSVAFSCAEANEAAEPELGQVSFPVSCSADAQVAFDRAVALLHHMTYPQAREEFTRVGTIDPQCAMAHWGVAMTLFNPVWPTRPGPSDLERGWQEVETARRLGPPTDRERLFIDAAAAFFEDPASSDYWLRIQRWERAEEAVYVAFPDDPDAASFYALAHLATTPADTISRTHADRAAEILLPVLARYPDHPGAMHYLIHANDMPGREHESLSVVRRYDSIAPQNPHALHMPTHIYTRLGDWPGVLRGNRRAAVAALAHPAGEFVSDEFPHAIEYLVYAFLQTGADDSALAWLTELNGTERLQPTFKTAFHLASTRARYALERHAWADAAGLAPRTPAGLNWDRFTWPEAITWFARGLGAAHLGRLDDARAAAERLSELEATTDAWGEALFARNIRVLRLELTAWIAHADGDGIAAVSLLSEAADLEGSTPKHAVTPGPTVPADELLGDLLTARGQESPALAAYEQSLQRYPGRFNSLLGAARAANAAGHEAAARTWYDELLTVAVGDGRSTDLQEARRFVSDAR